MHQRRFEGLKTEHVWGIEIDPMHRYNLSRWQVDQSKLADLGHAEEASASPIAKSIRKKEW